MKTFDVEWKTSIDAQTAKEAAENALALQRSGQSTATVYDVYERIGGPVKKHHRIDLTEEPQVRALQAQLVKMLDVSTAHITRATSIALGEKVNEIQAAQLWDKLSYTGWHDYGWIIFCSSDAAEAVREDHPELANLIDLCVKQDVSYLKLDADAPHLDDLPVFDW